MTIQFNSIPANIRVPFAYFEINAGQSPYVSFSRLLLIGQMTAAGTALVNNPVLVTGGEDGLFGVGSMLAGMYKIARAQGPFQEIWALPLADAVGSIAATATITINSVSAYSGTLVYYVGDVRVQVPVTTLMTVTQIAAATAVAINACIGMQVTATSALGVVTLTANNKGTLGNSIGVFTKLYPDDANTADTISTISASYLSGGASDPLITTGLTNLGDDEYDFIAMPYSQTAYVVQMEAFLDARWSYASQVYGHMITSQVGTAAALVTVGLARNSPRSTILGLYNVPAPSYLWCAALASVMAVHLQSPPELSRPLQTLQLVGLRAAKLPSDRWTALQRQSFYFAGISSYAVHRDGTVVLDRILTTYQKDSWGSQDSTWLDVNTIFQIMYGVRFLKQKLQQTYPRSALADKNPNNIQGMATPSDIRDTIIHGYRQLVAVGVFENAAMFDQLLVVERDIIDVNRVNVYLPVDTVNQLRILAVAVATYLQYPAAV